MKIIACCQPHYVPWIGYFEMIDRVDEFWFFDDVDFIKREWKNRNRIRKDRNSDESKWLSVPIQKTSQRGVSIAAAKLASEVDWRQRHLDSLRQVYAKAPYFKAAFELLESGLRAPLETLGELNAELVAGICRYLGIETPLGRTSSLGVEGRKTARLVAVCEAVGASGYLANNGSAAYLDAERFLQAGIACAYQDYVHPEYEQRSAGGRQPFLSHLSILDLIANHGPASLEILRAGRPVGA